jgi:hypothetical protein
LQQARQSAATNDRVIADSGDLTVEDLVHHSYEPSFGSSVESDFLPGTGPVVSQNVSFEAGLLPAPKPTAWPIPQSVFFLYSHPPGRGGPSRRIGTAFVLSVPDARRAQVDRYLVTARHVVEPEWAKCGEKDPQAVTVRFNRRTGGVGYETIALTGPDGPEYLTPADDVTDLALIPLSRTAVLGLDAYKLVETWFDQLPTDLELSSLDPQQQVVTAGVSPPRMAGLIDFPVSEPGTLATTGSGARLEVRCSAESPARPIQVWLMNSSVSQGVSGAPVYAAVAHGSRFEVTPLLVGIQSVVWPAKGLAGITPVVALADLMRSVRDRQRARGNIDTETHRPSLR